MRDGELAELRETLLALELKLMDPVFRKDREAVSGLLAVEFREFGSSGTEWLRDGILDLLATENALTPPLVEEFEVSPIALEAVLVTYLTLVPAPSSGETARKTLRSSVWVLREARWQIVFHQGTTQSAV
jgi:hypothetical protein